MGMTTTAASFASFHGPVVNHKGSGIIEDSNRRWIPLVYHSRLLWEVVVQGGQLWTVLRRMMMPLRHFCKGRTAMVSLLGDQRLL